MVEANIKPNDLEIYWVEPGADGGDPEADERVPTAQELRASSRLHQQNLKKSIAVGRPPGVRNRPIFAAASNKGIVLPAGLLPHAPGHPSLGAIASNTTILLPPLSDTVTQISRYDYVYLLCFGGLVTADIDPDINLAFEWANNSGAIQTLTQENTRRIRSFWAVIVSQGEVSATTVHNALPARNGQKYITGNLATAGAALSGTLQIYALDPNLIDTKEYFVLPDSIDLIDLCRVWRVQNFTQTGYTWNRTGEGDFEVDYHLQPTYRYVGEGWDDWGARSRDTLNRLMRGLPLRRSPTYDRVVTNLINGQIATNLSYPGIPTASPNGSTAIANGQRISFTNQAFVQKTYGLPVPTIDSGGAAQASVPFQVSSPAGSVFSQNAADHRVFAADGRDVTSDGTLTGLGGNGALTWTSNSATSVAPGDVVYIQPGIAYPAGSGFAYTGEIERVFYDVGGGSQLQINPANVREAAVGDLDAYAAPASSDQFFVVVGKERAALHYILKKMALTTNSDGVLTAPAGAGCIAFINGVAGRIDAPVYAGLTPLTNYDVLCYYPPAPTDKWQFVLKSSRYKGTNEVALLEGSTVAIDPIVRAHAQGGGNSTFLSDGEYQYELIANHLPTNSLPGAKKPHSADYRIQFVGEDDGVGATSYREWGLNLQPAAGLVLPRTGMQLSTVAAIAQARGMGVRLQNLQATVLGCTKQPIRCAQVYQLVCAFLVEKAGSRRLIVVTTNGGNLSQPSSVRFNTDAPDYSAIDSFNLY